MSRLIKIEGFDDYFVSDSGYIFSIKYGYPRKLKSRKNDRGYLYVNLSKNGKYKSKSIHRIVAKHFIIKPIGKDFVNHIDGNKINNCFLNLEWCTLSENSKHAVKNNLIKLPYSRGESNGFAKLKEKDVVNIKKDILNGIRLKVIAKQYNVSFECIRSIKRGNSWKHVLI